MFVSIGEAVIDYIQSREGSKFFVGGGPLNTALALAKFNESSAFFGSVSTDDYGKKIINYLIDSFVIFDPSLCCSEKQTMLSYVDNTLDPPVFDIKYKNTSVFDLKLEDLLKVLSVHSNINVIISGSVFITDDKCLRNLISVLKEYKESIFYLDLNIRPSVIEDMSSYLNRIMPLISRAEYIHASSEDLFNLNISETEFSKLGSFNLLYTDGDKSSSWLKNGNLVVSVPSVKCKNFKDSVGCGDVFNASILHYLSLNNLLGKDINENECKNALYLANISACLNTLNEGVMPPTWEEVLNAQLK